MYVVYIYTPFPINLLPAADIILHLATDPQEGDEEELAQVNKGVNKGVKESDG